MANFCLNTITNICGVDEDKLYWLFERIPRSTNKGSLLNDKGDEYVFDVCIDKDANTITFTTKYEPPIQTMTDIANEIDVQFGMSYEEIGSYIYGIFISYGKGDVKVFDVPPSTVKRIMNTSDEAFDELDKQLNKLILCW